MKTTREGKRFVIASFLIAVAAVNTGNNLIYLILSLMLAIVFLSLLLLKINLSGLSISVSIDLPVYAGDETPTTVLIDNTRGFIPAYSVHVEGGKNFSPVYFAYISSRGIVKKEATVKFPRRGLYGYGDFWVRSGFPFILFSSMKTIRVSGGVLVYPALRKVEHLLSGHLERDSGAERAIRGAGDEIYSIREFRYGDDWRRIHWKASAKAANLLVKEYSAYEFKKATLIFDNLKFPARIEREGGKGKTVNDRLAAQFEKAVSLAASLSKYFLDSGYHLRVLTCKKVIPFGSEDEHLFKVLDILALIKEEESWDSPFFNEDEGITISVLKSHDSQLLSSSTFPDMVVYADSV
jgi:uncharacterized protein (DUF58 family)